MKVLYATDGFEPAIEAGHLLERIGDKGSLDVTVMSVTHAGVPLPKHALLVLDPMPARRKDSLAIVDAAVEKLTSAGFKARGHIAEGHPGEELVRAVENDWYDLVVLGAGGRSWLGARLLGSVSTHVLHSSPSSVLVVHESLLRDEKARVLVGSDGSRGADLTVKTLASFADPACVEVTVVSVAPSQSPLVFPGLAAPYVSPDVIKHNEEVEKLMLDRARRHAEQAASHLRDAGFEVEAHTAVGSPTEQLLKEAESGQFDLVAVGSRGLGPFRRALMGSVSDALVRHTRAALIGRRLVP